MLQRGRRPGRFERKCAPKQIENRPCKPLETNGGTDELANRPEGRGFSTLLGWAFRPRNFMKNPPGRINREQRANRRRGFSPLSTSDRWDIAFHSLLRLAKDRSKHHLAHRGSFP